MKDTIDEMRETHKFPQEGQKFWYNEDNVLYEATYSEKFHKGYKESGNCFEDKEKARNHKLN